MKIKKTTLKMTITKRNTKTLTDVRTVIFLQKYKSRYNKFPNRQRILETIFKSNLSWQKRKVWIDKIIDWDGPRGENYEWQCILHNSEEIAKNMLIKKLERVQGDKNPWAKHNGKYSPWTKGSVNYSQKSIDKANKNRTYDTRISYYLNKGFGLCISIKKLKERQSTNRLDKFIERHGEEEGKRRWLLRQEKWQTTLNNKDEKEKARINSSKHSTGYSVSKGEKEIFSELKIKFPNLSRSKTIFYNSGKNYFVYDIFIDKKIIEYNGDMWHANPIMYKENFINPITKKTAIEIWEKENKKINLAIENGYQITVVWESEYKENKEKTIDKCIEFLYE